MRDGQQECTGGERRTNGGNEKGIGDGKETNKWWEGEGVECSMQHVHLKKDRDSGQRMK